MGPAFEEVVAALADQGLHPAGPPFCRYSMGSDGMDDQGRAAVFVLAAGFPCSAPAAAAGRAEPMQLPGGSAVVAVHVGAYPELGEAYAAVAQYMGEHDLEPAGDPWESYLDGPEVEVHRTFPHQPVPRFRSPCSSCSAGSAWRAGRTLAARWAVSARSEGRQTRPEAGRRPPRSAWCWLVLAVGLVEVH